MLYVPSVDMSEVNECIHMNFNIYADEFLFREKYKDNQLTISYPSDVRVAIMYKNNKVYIVVRGTDNLKNTLFDIMALPVTNTDLGFDCKFHKGFNKVAQKKFRDIENEGTLSTTVPIVVTGHSMGGSVAVILAMLLQEEGYNIEKCITFGQPKVTLRKYVEACHAVLGDKYLRVCNFNDAVPNVPTGIFGILNYQHFGDELLLDPNGSKLVKAPIIRDHGFFKQFFLETIAGHHTQYYLDNINKV